MGPGGTGAAVDRILRSIDAGLADEHQHSSEPGYLLPNRCWRCDDADQASDIGLCGPCLSAIRADANAVEDVMTEVPRLDLHRPMTETLGAFSRAVTGPDLVRCSFVHPDPDLLCKSVVVGTTRFTVDPPIVLERLKTYYLVIDGTSGLARIEPDG